jgi:hypothetical protein
MVCFQTKNPNVGKMGRALDWKMLLYFMKIWYNLHPFGIVCGHLVYIFRFCIFGCLDKEKSGNPGGDVASCFWIRS